MAEYVEIESLDKLMDGAVTERFHREFNRLLDNVYDPNTDAQASRKITMTVVIKPDKQRQSAAFNVDIKSTLASPVPLVQTVPEYWDCECKEFYIHPVEDEYCHICGNTKDEMPDSRQNEIDAGTHFAKDRRVERSKWIPCSERLPEMRERVLSVFQNDDFRGVGYGYIKPLRRKFPYEWVASSGEYFNYTEGGGKSYVTYWMPMPELPEQEVASVVR